MSDNTHAGAVFLSYAREDAEAARRIADALRAFGVEVWFDQNELRGGDSWDAKIKKQIRECTLFMPVVSAQTQARGEGYFRREWKLAVERTHDMAAGVPFLMPVVIDETKESDALVPDEFMRLQWSRLLRGVPTPLFVDQVKRLLEGPRKPGAESARPPSPVRGEAEAPAKKSGLSGWSWGAGFAVIVAITTAVMVGRKAEPVAAPAPVPAPAAPEVKPAAPVLPKLDDKSIAVLPFTNMSEDKDNAFFADGIHEDILTNLALIRELRVVSRTTVMQYRDTKKPIAQIAAELGVTYILEGSVRRFGNKVRVTGQLIHASSDEHVWAQAYDRDLTDIFAIQTELSQQIAGALKTALSPEEKVLIARRPTTSPVAYDLFLRARETINRDGITPASIAKQVTFLQSAVDQDPSFAQAWGELAAACAFAYFTYADDMDAQLARAKEAIQRAMQLAPDSPEVIESLGTYYYYGYRDYDRATEQYQRLASLQPNSPIVFNSLALIQRRQGHWAQSLVYSRRASELDPANISYLRTMVATLVAGRRWDDARAAQRRIVALLPDNPRSAYYLALLQFYATGSTREVEAFFAGLSPTVRDSPQGIKLRLDWAGEHGDYAEAVRLDRLQPYFDDDGDPHWQQAILAAGNFYALGDKAAAIARLGDFPAEVRTLVEREPKNVTNWSFLSNLELTLGHKEEAIRCADRSVELLPESRDALDGVTMTKSRAILLDWAGEKERALAEYARLLHVPSPFFLNVYDLKNQKSPLVGDPRFEALVNDPANNAPLF